jgi:3-methyladenine DNA glycosylase/8-oxoguanine DNA glycosylase
VEATRTFEVQGPLDVRSTLRMQFMWGASTWLKVDDTGAWYARRTVDGPGTVRLRQRGDRLLAQAWGPGAERVLDSVPALLGLGSGGLQVEGHHPQVRELAKRFSGLRVGRTDHVYPRLVAVALAQKVTGKNGKAGLGRIARRWGEPAPGPREDLFLLPEPGALSRRPYYDFHPLGVERHRADLLKRIASRASALQRAVGMPHGEGRAHLEKLRGIGPWTSGVVMGGGLGDPDAVPIGDYHLPNYVSFNLAGEPRGDDARMMQLLEPYAGVRGVVVRMIKMGGKAPPKYGPKSAVRDIREM